MRLIGILPKEDMAQKFSYVLQKEKIEFSIDVQMDSVHETFSYGIWVHDEDDLEKAKSLFDEFQKNPNNAKYSLPIKIHKDQSPENSSRKDEAEKKQMPNHGFFDVLKYKFTFFTILVCSMIFLINLFQRAEIIKKEGKTSASMFTPVQFALFYDVPKALEDFEKILKKYKIDPGKKLSEQTSDVKKVIEKMEHLPMWKGVYEAVVEKWKNPNMKWDFSGPMFEKIRKGQIWRLISPIILHVSFLHLLFNMLWLWILGKQLEERISKLNLTLLVIIVGVVSNTVQYLISGPLFLGYSGVILGMVGYIWIRQKIAPWEGYPLPKITILFLTFYVLAMMVLSFSSFVFEVFEAPAFSPNIANAAHICGAITGIILGRFPILIGRKH